MADKPYKHVYMVEGADGPDGKPRTWWTKVGIAFVNRDGSWSVSLSAVPVTGRILIRDPSPNDKG
jgi:hypothetical protein